MKKVILLISVVAISFASCTTKQSNQITTTDSTYVDSTYVDSVTLINDSVAQIPDSL